MVVTFTTSLGIANGTLWSASSITLFQGNARGYLAGDKDQFLPIKISWSICYHSQVLLGVVWGWSRRLWPGLPLESAACRGALRVVVDNTHSLLFVAVVLSGDLVTTYPCPVITSRRAGLEGYKGVNQLQVVPLVVTWWCRDRTWQGGLLTLPSKTSIVLKRVSGVMSRGRDHDSWQDFG